MQRGGRAATPGTNVRSGVYEELYYFGVTRSRGDVQGRVAALVQGVDVGAGGD